MIQYIIVFVNRIKKIFAKIAKIIAKIVYNLKSQLSVNVPCNFSIENHSMVMVRPFKILSKTFIIDIPIQTKTVGIFGILYFVLN